MQSEPAHVPTSPLIEYPRVYRTRVITHVLGYAAGALLAAAGVGMASTLSSPLPPDELVAAVLSALLLAAGVALAIYTARYRMILEADAVSVIGLWGRHRLALADIAGRRRLVDPRHDSSKTRIEPKSSTHKRIELSNGILVTDAAYRAWIDQLPDLDAEDLRRTAAKSAAELATDADAAARSKKAHAVTPVLHAVGLALAFWGIAMPQPYHVVLVVLAVAPWLALALTALSKGAFRIDLNRSSPNPNAAGLFVLPATALAMRAVLDVSLAAPADLLLPAAVVAAPMIGLLFRIEPNVRRLQGLLMLTLVCGFAAAMVALANVELDHAPAEVHRAHVTGKRMSQGKQTEYDLTLDWLPGGRQKTAVPRSVYDAVEVGSPVVITVRPGALHLEWYSVLPE